MPQRYRVSKVLILQGVSLSKLPLSFGREYAQDLSTECGESASRGANSCLWVGEGEPVCSEPIRDAKANRESQFEARINEHRDKVVPLGSSCLQSSILVH